jgi:c-di-GMP-binding flagellar brake protein YcgR
MTEKRQSSMPRTVMAERRKEERLKERNKVAIRPLRSGRKGPETGAYTYDLSVWGARIFSQDHFDVGTPLEIRIELGRTRQTVSLLAKVKWQNYREEDELYEMGVEFRHRVSESLIAFIRHLYGTDQGLPSSIG